MGGLLRIPGLAVLADPYQAAVVHHPKSKRARLNDGIDGHACFRELPAGTRAAGRLPLI